MGWLWRSSALTSVDTRRIEELVAALRVGGQTTWCRDLYRGAGLTPGSGEPPLRARYRPSSLPAASRFWRARRASRNSSCTPISGSSAACSSGRTSSVRRDQSAGCRRSSSHALRLPRRPASGGAGGAGLEVPGGVVFLGDGRLGVPAAADAGYLAEPLDLGPQLPPFLGRRKTRNTRRVLRRSR